MQGDILLSPLDLSSLPFVADLFDGTIISETWDCNIRSILHDLIKDHNEYLTAIGDPPEETFLCLEKQPTTLASLICEDMKYVRRFVPTAVPPEPISVTEISSNTLSAEMIDITSDNRSLRVLGFHSSLLIYINDFFLKFHTMLSYDRYARCLPLHRPILEQEDYDDYTLLLSLYNNAEILVNPSTTKELNGPPFLGEPYDVCEQIEAARRFAVLHEFGHAWYRDLKTGKPHKSLDDALARRFASTTFYHVADALGAQENCSASEMLSRIVVVQGIFEPRRIRHFVEELWCDLYAFTVIEQLFQGRLKSISVIHECGNALLGIMDLFFMLSVIEKGVGKYDPFTSNYPSSDFRAKLVFEYIWSSPLFMNKQICKTALGRAKRYKAAYQVFCGAAANPGIFVRMLSELTPFGRRFRENLFHGVVSNHWSSISDAAEQLIIVEMIRSQRKEKRRMEILGKLLDRGGRHLQEGSAIIAEQSARKALALAGKDSRGADDIAAAGLMILGGALNKQQRFSDAEGVLREALTKNKHVEWKGPILLGLGRALNQLERYAEGEIVLRPLVEILEGDSNYEPMEVVSALNEVGESLDGQGRYKEAEYFHRRALSVLETRKIVSDSNLAGSLLILGINLHRQDAYVQSEGVLRRAVEIAEKIFGPLAIQTAHTLIWLVASLEGQDRLLEAEHILKDVVKIRESILGATHPDTINSLRRLALLLYDQDKYREYTAVIEKLRNNTPEIERPA